MLRVLWPKRAVCNKAGLLRYGGQDGGNKFAVAIALIGFSKRSDEIKVSIPSRLFSKRSDEIKVSIPSIELQYL